MTLVAIVITVATLAGMLIRPGGRSEAFFAGVGGAAMLAVTAVSLSAAWTEVRHAADILLFLLGMMIVTTVVESSGLFDHLAEAGARLARGSGPLLLANVFLLGTAVTTVLSLDAMIIVMTPIIHALTIRRRLDPVPYLFACAFVANTGSLLLPISNLTNLLAFSDLGLGFGDFARTMWLPNICAVVANYIIFRWLFRARIPKRVLASTDTALPPADRWLWFCAAALAATLCGLAAMGFTRNPLSIAALTGAGVLVAGAAITKRIGARRILDGATPSLFVFVVGLLIVVRGVTPFFVRHVEGAAPGSSAWAAVAGALGAGAGSNVINNVPVTLLALAASKTAAAAVRAPMMYGVLVGANIGPTLTTYGSLATMLWLTILRKRGFAIETRAYMRISLVTMPLVLLAALAGLLLVL